MTMMNKFVIGLLLMTVTLCASIWIAAEKEWIHTRWNYDDSEYHYVMRESRLLDLEIQSIDCDLYEAIKRIGVLQDYVNKHSRFRDETPTRYE